MPASTKKNLFGFKLALLGAAVLAANSFAALPEMRITASKEPTSRSGGSCPGAWSAATGTHLFDYVAVTNFQITGASVAKDNITRSSKPDSLRLRGNSTADATKKPYRIKFGEKVSLFGKEAAKSWVLLANYYDGTFALNAIAFEMGTRMGLEYTNSSQLVDLYINNQYKGIYQLTEQVQANDARVNLREKHRGWLMELDYHAPASDECKQAFVADPAPSSGGGQCYYNCPPATTSGNYNLTLFIKSPQLDDTSFTRNPNDSSSLRFVKTDINNLVTKMKASNFPENGYRDMIDLDSYAKYVLIQLVLDNFDFNSKTQTGGLPGSNYLYRRDSSSSSKIKAGPLWDFDLAAGVRNDGGGFCFSGQQCPPGFPQHYQTYQDPVTPTSQNYSHAFYKRLWEDKVFKAKYKKLWLKHKSDFQAMSSLIDNIKSQVENSVESKGANAWANNTMMGGGTLTRNQFNTEVTNLKTWLTNRINWVDGQINVNSIDTSWDIQSSPEYPTPVVSSAPAKSGNSLSVVKNGLNISATANASMKVFSLSGVKVRNQSFSAGTYAVKLGDLPQGVYLVRVNLDGVKKTVRVPVR
ncbi:MAG: CotH kinase family protein [Chitinispirillales bacterium]|jgi:hypothetical protein|nr:CotH kinase family protein [Chitinispirillales bacterium]